MRVITTLLCSNVDPQRGYTWPAEFSRYRPWAESIRRHGHTPILLTDSGRDWPGLDVVQVKPGDNPYFHRWQVIADYLEHDVDPVWVTDGTDVVMLHDPAQGMRHGPLYVGVDIYPVGCDWMRRTCPGYRYWIAAHATRMLMNAGLLGGPACDVRLAARMIADQWPVDAVHDMAAFNQTLMQFEREGWELVVGWPVNTRMHDYDHAHPTAWFAHK